MSKNQKILIFGAIGIFLALIALIIVLIVKNDQHTQAVNEIQEQADSLKRQNDSMELANLTSEFDRLNAEFLQIDDQIDDNSAKALELKNDSLVRQYNQAKARVNSLIKELEQEKKSNKVNLAKIKQLEDEISTLKGIARHYLEEINRLNQENAGLRQEIATEKTKNETLVRENQSVSQSNAQLSQTVQLAKKLNITSLSMTGYKGNKSSDKLGNINKFGVSFIVTPNNTAAPGMKTFYVRIISPEGNLLGGGPSFTYDGASLQSSAARQMEYDNQELPVSVYWDKNTTLTPGDYKVEVFADGYRLGSRSFNFSKK